MTDVTIIPAADTSIELTPSSAGSNWSHVLAWPDYVRGSADGAYKTDIYSPLVTVMAGTVSNVRIYYDCYATAAGHHAKPVIYTNSTYYYGTATTVPGDSNWHRYYYDFAINPNTGVAWETWPDIALLKFGVQLDHTTVLATTVYIVVTYSPTLGAAITANYLGSVFTQYILNNWQTISVYGTLRRAANHTKPLIVATNSNIVGGTDALISGAYNATADPILYLIGECEVRGNSSSEPLTVGYNLGSGVQFMNPTNCLAQDLIVTDCRSGTPTAPVVGDASMGVPLLFYGAGSGNVARRCTIKRGGLHGLQIYGSSNNLLDYIDVDGVYGYFGLSLYQTDNTTAQNITTANTRREGVNLMQCTGSSLTDFAVRNCQTDYGVSDYLCDGSTIQNGTIDRTHKDGLAIVGSDNGQYDHIIITKACQGRYIGHYAGIMLEGSDSVGCENNTVEWCTIEDLDHRQIFNIKEVAYIPSGTNLTNSNIIRNNRCYGAIRGPARTVGSLSTQTNNGVIEIV